MKANNQLFLALSFLFTLETNRASGHEACLYVVKAIDNVVIPDVI